jgi:hypothetical protein
LTSIAAIASHLLDVSAARETTHTKSRPAQVAHHRGKSSTGRRRAVALCDFQSVEHVLRSDALDAVGINAPAKTFQAHPPRVCGACGKLLSGLLHPAHQRHDTSP